MDKGEGGGGSLFFCIIKIMLIDKDKVNKPWEGGGGLVKIFPFFVVVISRHLLRLKLRLF